MPREGGRRGAGRTKREKEGQENSTVREGVSNIKGHIEKKCVTELEIMLIFMLICAYLLRGCIGVCSLTGS